MSEPNCPEGFRPLEQLYVSTEKLAATRNKLYMTSKGNRVVVYIHVKDKVGQQEINDMISKLDKYQNTDLPVTLIKQSYKTCQFPFEEGELGKFVFLRLFDRDEDEMNPAEN